MAVDLARFRQTFIDESREALDSMESGLLGVETSGADPEVINAIFRAAHSIKGGAGTFGFAAIAGFTHHVETLLDQMRGGRRAVTPDVLGLLLGAVDVLRIMVDHASRGDSDAAVEAGPVEAALRALLAAPEAAAPAAVAAGPAAVAGWQVHFAPHADMLSRGNDPYRLLRELALLGEATITADAGRLPSLTAMDPEQCYLAWQVTLRGAAIPREAVQSVFEWVEDECTLVVEPLAAEAPVAASVAAEAAPRPASGAATGAPPAAPAATGVAAPHETTSIRVNTTKLDELVNLVGELVITQSMLGQVGRDFDIRKLETLQAGLAQLERNTRELQESVMRIRMVPISAAFNRFPRLVHDISSKLGKKVELRTTGEQTELDKTVIEKIGDPLVHLVRNALDHGLETPAERVAAGKPEAGTLTLSACHRGGEIVIEITDDGRGIVRERVRAKATERGLLAPGQALSDAELLEFIWHPGFSTAAAVSDLSGRGVGMDVVRQNIHALGGSIDLQSREGEGTRLAIRLPLTLAILDGQLARIGSQTFVVPLVSIVESLKIVPAQLSSVAQRAQVYRLRNEYIPVLRAHELFGIGDASGVSDAMLMVVESDGRRAGVLVDELLAQQQVVIKSLEANFRAVPGLSGATILGDGTVALILDVPGLVGMAQRGGEGGRRTQPRDGTAVAA